MHEQGPVDFIEVIHNAVPTEVCAAIVERLRATRGLMPGAVGSGVFPELKHSKDLRISCLLYTSPSPRDKRQSRMPSSA